MRAAGGREKKKQPHIFHLLRPIREELFVSAELDLIPPSSLIRKLHGTLRESAKNTATHSRKKINRQFFLMKFRAQFEYGANKLIGT
jgi:hypothetical protein